MILSKTAEYGIRVALHLARSGSRPGFVPSRELAERCDIPFHFLGKICHRMTVAGILDSHKGPHGGVALVRSPAELTLLEVVEALDGTERFSRCFLGLPNCPEQPCPVHESWVAVKEEILAMLSDRTLSELARQDAAAGEVELNEIDDLATSLRGER